jgi:hypothetical protein
MKKTKLNLEHQIQLKQDELRRYLEASKNYPEERMKKYGVPYIQGLQNELTILNNELEEREGRREIDNNLGYSRIGRNNI